MFFEQMKAHNSQYFIWRKPNLTYERKHLMKNVKHDGGGVMI